MSNDHLCICPVERVEVVLKPSLGPDLCVELRCPILEILIPPLAGSSGCPPQPALILNPIESFETPSMASGQSNMKTVSKSPKNTRSVYS